eukprot:14349944-Alexandrium_andersonii.AAC.1
MAEAHHRPEKDRGTGHHEWLHLHPDARPMCRQRAAPERGHPAQRHQGRLRWAVLLGAEEGNPEQQQDRAAHTLHPRRHDRWQS